MILTIAAIKKLQNLFNRSYGSISHHITPLVITSLGQTHRHTDTDTHTHTHTHTRTHTHTHTHTHTYTHTLRRHDQIPETKHTGLWPVHAWFKLIASVVCLVGLKIVNKI